MPPRGRQVCRNCGHTVVVAFLAGVATQLDPELITVVPADDHGRPGPETTFARRVHGETCAQHKAAAARAKARRSVGRR